MNAEQMATIIATVITSVVGALYALRRNNQSRDREEAQRVADNGKEQSSLLQQISQVERQGREQRDVLEKQVRDLEAKIEDLTFYKVGYQNLTTLHNQLQARYDQLANDVSTLQGQVKTLETALKAAHETNGHLNGELETKTKALVAAEAENASYEKAFSLLGVMVQQILTQALEPKVEAPGEPPGESTELVKAEETKA